ncbi:MAG: hypothetical protein JO257_08880 [Deltaproteobacteria bacterium]|nr:hypothetical protein [Deltaproteobacteria bacterium]
MKRVLWLVLVVACKKHEAEPVAQQVPAATIATDPATFRTKHTLTATPKGSASGFELTDGTGQFTLTLPNEPKLQSDMMSQGGVQVWNAQAVMPGGDVDVQFGAMTVPDGDLPVDLSQLDAIPAQLAGAVGGTLVHNAPGTLAGMTAQIFELTTGDKRRLFGWYAKDTAHARVFQINCVGADVPKTKDACAAVAATLVVKP